MNILEKINQASLVGRGGASFSVADKWSSFESSSNNQLIINASEGEPGVLKDGYILEHHLEQLVLGAKLASDFISAKSIVLYLNPKFKDQEDRFLTAFKSFGQVFSIFYRPNRLPYLAGEETVILNLLAGRRLEPRLKPPFPSQEGILIHNVETLYDIALLSENKYQGNRFYTINGQVYSLDKSLTIGEILKKSNQYPLYPFFVQSGGGVSGEVLNSKQLDVPVSGAGAIIIHNLKEHSPLDLVRSWIEFVFKNSCGQCTPGREGLYRLRELLQSESDFSNSFFLDILETLQKSSRCTLASSLSITILSYLKNVYEKNITGKN